MRIAALLLFASCSSSEPRADAGTARRSKLAADGGLFVDPDRREEELAREILRDMDRLAPAVRLGAGQVTIGAAYHYRFAFERDELAAGDRAIAVPVTLERGAPEADTSDFVLATDRGARVASEPIVEWLDETSTTIVERPSDVGSATDRRMLLVYFAPRSFEGGSLLHGGRRLGDVRLGTPGPVRPRSRCELLGAFAYAPIERKLFVELRVERALGTWTPLATAVDAGPEPATSVPCAGYRRLGARGELQASGTPAPHEGYPTVRFLAEYDLPAGSTPGLLAWEGTDCEATAVPERAPLPRRLGPDRGPPLMEEVPASRR